MRSAHAKHVRVLNRKTESIEDLLSGVREIFGVDSIRPCGDWDDPRSVGFRPAKYPVRKIHLRIRFLVI